MNAGGEFLVLKGWKLVLALFPLFGFGCAHEQGHETAGEERLPIRVELDLPEQAEAGHPVKVAAQVFQENEPVDDADEVMFEVWKKDSKEESFHFKPSAQDGGIYSFELIPEEGGTYIVQVHVTARGMHAMPKKELKIISPTSGE
jgi:hypothetical protein